MEIGKERLKSLLDETMSTTKVSGPKSLKCL